MGGKPTWYRNAVYLCIALLIFLTPLACTFGKPGVRITDVTGEEARGHLALARKFLAEGNFNSALRENEEVIALAGINTPVDESLFCIGLIHAHPANPARNIGKSLAVFRKLISDYPKSPLADQARAVVGLIQDNGRLRDRVERLNGEVDLLTNDVGRLNRLIGELKKVDIEAEQKRREKGR
jgi:hypothetical protein